MEMSTLLEKAISATREAGKEVLRFYETPRVEIKPDGSPVTLADIRSQEILSRHLSSTSIPVLSEESDGIQFPYPERLWIVDPLDGTKDFLKKTKDFSVMVGLVEQGHPVLGVVYVPALDIQYYGSIDCGSFKIENGITTRLSVATNPSGPLRFLCSVNNFAPYMDTVAEKLSATKIPRGSVGVKAGLIGENHGDFFFSHGALGEWDVCAPEIILREAGGVVSDCLGRDIVYGNPQHRIQHGMIFAQRKCYDEVLEAVSEMQSL